MAGAVPAPPPLQLDLPAGSLASLCHLEAFVRLCVTVDHGRLAVALQHPRSTRLREDFTGVLIRERRQGPRQRRVIADRKKPSGLCRSVGDDFGEVTDW